MKQGRRLLSRVRMTGAVSFSLVNTHLRLIAAVAPTPPRYRPPPAARRRIPDSPSITPQDADSDSSRAGV